MRSSLIFLTLSSSKIPDVIYKMPSKIGPKNALFRPDFCPFFAPKPLHIVVNLPYLPFKPLFVIRTILSTCLEDTKKMPLEPGGALAAGYNSKNLLYVYILEFYISILIKTDASSSTTSLHVFMSVMLLIASDTLRKPLSRSPSSILARHIS